LAVGDDQKGQFHIFESSTLDRPIAGRRDHGVMLQIGDEGFFQNFPQVLQSHLDGSAEDWYLLPRPFCGSIYLRETSPIITSWHNATGTR
jgi:hypothetical protein